jgi:predicted metal-dependent hydrolase
MDGRGLTVRRPSFQFDPSVAATWLGGSRMRSHAFNALSVLLPGGEAFFVRVVGEIRIADAARIPEPLMADLEAFMRQESAHRRHHQAYNQALLQRHPSVPRSLRDMDRSWARVERLASPISRLAITVSIEHFTSIFARATLRALRGTTEADQEYAELWIWHALEELEHQSVAFDLYAAIGGSKVRLGAAMVGSTVIFAFQYATFLSRLLSDGDVREGGRLQAVMSAISGPVMRAVVSEYLTFFRPRFRPGVAGDCELVLEALDRLQGRLHGAVRPVVHAHAP